MCTRPNYMIWKGDWTKNDRPDLEFIGHHSYDNILALCGDQIPYIQVPCGQCLECRIQQTRQWADRCVLEAKKYKHNYFVTLTYDDEHLPPNGSLCLRDVQLFLKRLRRKFKKTKIRVVYSGEYGDASLRPHYHLLLFNLPLRDCSNVFQMYDRDKKRYVNYLRPSKSSIELFYSRTIYDLWTDADTVQHLGNISVGKVNYDTAAYVSQYVQKKCNPKMAETYRKLHLVPEFLHMSNRPGIGADYFEDHDDGIYSTHLIVPGNGLAHKSAIPRYFDKLFIKKYGEDIFNPIRAKRLLKRSKNIETYLADDTNADRQASLRDYNLKKLKKLRTQI